MRIETTRSVTRIKRAVPCRTLPYSSSLVCLALDDCLRRFASPRSYERMDSPRTRWFASEKNGSGFTATTSNGRRWRMTDCLRNRRTALDRSSPARANSSSASCLRSESTRICNVDVVISQYFVVRLVDIISKMHSRCNSELNTIQFPSL